MFEGAKYLRLKKEEITELYDSRSAVELTLKQTSPDTKQYSKEFISTFNEYKKQLDFVALKANIQTAKTVLICLAYVLYFRAVDEFHKVPGIPIYSKSTQEPNSESKKRNSLEITDPTEAESNVNELIEGYSNKLKAIFPSTITVIQSDEKTLTFTRKTANHYNSHQKIFYVAPNQIGILTIDLEPQKLLLEQTKPNPYGLFAERIKQLNQAKIIGFTANKTKEIYLEHRKQEKEQEQEQQEQEQQEQEQQEQEQQEQEQQEQEQQEQEQQKQKSQQDSKDENKKLIDDLSKIITRYLQNYSNRKYKARSSLRRATIETFLLHGINFDNLVTTKKSPSEYQQILCSIFNQEQKVTDNDLNNTSSISTSASSASSASSTSSITSSI